MLESVFNNDASLRVCNIIKKKSQHMYFPVKFAKFLRTLSLNNISEQLLLYFHYNLHQHYRYHHFHYHCKMHLYRLRILLTIPLDCNMVPWLFWHIFVSSLIPNFLLFMHSKRTQNSFMTTRHFLDVLFILILISIGIYNKIF